MSKRTHRAVNVFASTLRILAALAVFWGGGIALFSGSGVPFRRVMAERQISARSA